jgi:hypothetical protein
MPIPTLTSYGVLPEGIHECTAEEIFISYCAANSNRRMIWELFQEVLDLPRHFIWPEHIYIDGGFTSNKPQTKDIDVVLDISHLDDHDAYTAFGWLSAHRELLSEKYRVDFWLKHSLMQNNLVDFFQYIKEEEILMKGMPTSIKKGLLRMPL